MGNEKESLRAASDLSESTSSKSCSKANSGSAIVN